MNDNSKRLVNRVIGLRLVEKRESVLEWCVGRQLAIKVSLRTEVSAQTRIRSLVTQHL